MTIDGKDMFIYSAAFHYFRCPEALWRDRFRDIKRPDSIRLKPTCLELARTHHAGQSG